ncbi:MAG: hypothetical protein HQL82_08265 [Magnetococcales bacterium]|nr:hypothetical protein [Magnetococcales bacterium]
MAETTLGPQQRIRPGATPAGQDDQGQPLWHPQDVEPLRSRKGWRRKGRRVPDEALPVRQIVQDSGPLDLFAPGQTISEQQYLESHRDKITALARRWETNWIRLQERLEDWQTTLGDHPIQEGEERLLALWAERKELLARRAELTHGTGLLKIPLPQPDLDPWQEAVEQFRETRLRAIITQDRLDDPTLAREIGLELVELERDLTDSPPLTPYWEFYNRFLKRFEAARTQRNISQITRIREFHALFPAREEKRHFTLYLGPTNSGKTYQALQRLAGAENGVYLAPLRLLAQEVAQTLNQWGIFCNLMTGEERIPVPGAQHTASTIEMLPLHQHYELAVIDEAQMLADPDRGWAWTQAILGVRATEVCVVGSPEVQPILTRLLELTGESLEVVTLERLTPLQLLNKPVGSFDELEPGTALVAFSRSDVLALKAMLERETGQRAAVVYGALPPEVRRQQARMFASGEAPFLAATDAIGMGLNLPIRTLLFTADRKFINRQEHLLTPLEVRQIAGRAGRFGQNEIGFVGSFRIPMAHLRVAFHTRPAPVRRACLAPNLDHLLAIAEHQGQQHPRLAPLLTLFLQAVKPDPTLYRLGDLDDQTLLARITDRHASLDLATRFLLSAAPVPIRSTSVVDGFAIMVAAVARERPLSLTDILPTTQGPRHRQLGLLETATRMVDLYCWLHYRFPTIFPDIEEAIALRGNLNGRIGHLLSRVREERGYSRTGSPDKPRPDRKGNRPAGTPRPSRSRRRPHPRQH